MQVTDEMVEVACAAAGDTIATGYHARRDRPSKRCAEREMRAALEAVLPMIRAEVLEEAAKVADEEANAWREARDVAAAIRALKGDALDPDLDKLP